VVVISLALAGISATDVFQLLPDGIDGTLIRVANVLGSQAPCYAAGTRILTEAGEVAVEDLRPGVRVVAMGRRPMLRQVRWWDGVRSTLRGILIPSAFCPSG